MKKTGELMAGGTQGEGRGSTLTDYKQPHQALPPVVVGRQPVAGVAGSIPGVPSSTVVENLEEQRMLIIS